MSWGLVVAGGSALAGAYGVSEQKKATKEAGDLSADASKAALARSEEAFGQSEAALSPYARQEQAASSQLMQQMGLAPPGGGGAGMGGGGDGWGFGATASGLSGEDQANYDDFLEQLLGQSIATAFKSGTHRSAGVREGAQKATDYMRELQKEGRLPAGLEIPDMEAMIGRSQALVKKAGGYKGITKDFSPGDMAFDSRMGREEYGFENVQALADEFGITEGFGTTQADDQRYMGEGGPGAPGGGAQTAGAIMGRAGVEGIPPELREQYMQDLMADPQQDPELAAYLGLTPESMDVGQSYQDTQAYQGAVEAGTSAVNQGAAGSGSLYSGRRGLALRDVGQEVEQGYYMDAADRRADMMGARRNERTRGIARRGAEYGTGRQREDSYYNNYMQQLMTLSNPTTTTNIETMRRDAAQAEGSNLMGTARDAGNLGIAGANAQQAGIADLSGGLMGLAGSWIDRPRTGVTAPTGVD